MSTLAWAARLAVVLPALAAVLGLLLSGGSRARARGFALVGTGGALLAALVELAAAAGADEATRVGLLGPVPTGSVAVRLDVRADELSALVAVAVAVVALAVQLYSTAYLAHDRRYPGYAATVSLFTAAMLLVVHADDLLLLLVGWEVMGLCSYLLVGHDSEREAARRAAVKAFLVTRVADVAFVLGIVVLLVGARTTSITDLLTLAAPLGDSARDVASSADLSTTWQVAGVLLVIGVIGKSAQIPFHSWLPDAMEGPTPVSALIHAATMVAAGSYVVARLLPVLVQAPAARGTLAVVAAVSMLGAALAALVQTDLKRLLAYSTVSQIAYMLAALAVATPESGSAAGVGHLLSHAAYKALLFLAAGALAHQVGSTALAGLGGAWRRAPLVAGLFTLGLLALAGVPPFAGFWSKEAVLGTAEDAALHGTQAWAGWVVLVAGLLTTAVTAAYATRAWALVVPGRAAQPPVDLEVPQPPPAAPGPAATASAGSATSARSVHDADGHRLPSALTTPLLVLAVPTVLGGLLLLTPPAGTGEVHVGLLTTLATLALTVVGAGLAVLAARRSPEGDVALLVPDRLRGLLASGYAVDTLQERLVVRPVRALARLVVVGDRDVVDAYVRGGATGSDWLGRLAARAQTGSTPQYLGWVLAGALAAGVWVLAGGPP